MIFKEMTILFYNTVDLPYSKAICVTNDDNILLLKAIKDCSEENFLKQLSTYNLNNRKNKVINLLETELDLYFSKQIRVFSSKLSPNGSAFQSKIWHSLLKIPYGKTISYSEFAKISYSSNHTRSSASAIAKNPIEILIPCHRIINRNGNYGNYSAGAEAKKFLIELESNK